MASWKQELTDGINKSVPEVGTMMAMGEKSCGRPAKARLKVAGGILNAQPGGLCYFVALHPRQSHLAARVKLIAAILADTAGAGTSDEEAEAGGRSGGKS